MVLKRRVLQTPRFETQGWCYKHHGSGAINTMARNLYPHSFALFCSLWGSYSPLWVATSDVVQPSANKTSRYKLKDIKLKETIGAAVLRLRSSGDFFSETCAYNAGTPLIIHT
jgi:hypothetical protein